MLTCTGCAYAVRVNAKGHECYRYPPTVSKVVFPNGQVEWDNLRPFVSNDEKVCGEYQQRDVS